MSDRIPLSAERIVDAAAAVADDGGVSAVTMRSVGRELGVEAMSLYHHVASKDALIDALTDWVFARIELPRDDEAWRDGVQRHARSTRAVLTAHPWALALVETRTSPGTAVLRRHDAQIGCLLRGGFSLALAAHAASLVDAYVYGFALTERNLPFDPATGASDYAAEVDVAWEHYPHLAGLVGELTGDGDYSFSDEFEIGLDIILDALERRLGGSASSGDARPSAGE
ncbi:MAG: TetR/AcrR family transcriptional regulator C-terminal domain-containing protein [Pseudoclavibacter sp.]